MIEERGARNAERGAGAASPNPSYVELHCHSNFSLLDGASHPEELVERAAALGMPALALTDHDAVYGAVRFIEAARAHGVHPVLGAELTLADGHHLTLLVESEEGWHNLCYLISRARHNAPKGEAALPADELLGCTAGLIALSGCRQGAVAAALLRGDRQAALRQARTYRDLFGPDHFWIELQNHLLPGDAYLISRLVALAGYLGLGCVATNNVHYATQDRHRLQDVLVCIRHNLPLDAAIDRRRLNSEYALKTGAELVALFPNQPEALAHSLRLAERCQFDLRYSLQDLPHFPTPHGMHSSAFLRRLCGEALLARFGDPPPDLARRQLNHELAVIEQGGLANYFLIVWDIVRHARAEGIRCQGRGSAANSLVAYLLHISPINPLAHDLVFERFLSAERLRDRRMLPDIDIDFDAARREEVIQYLYQTYGEAHAAMACTYVTFRQRSAIRDVGKALGLSAEVVASALAALDTDGVQPAGEQQVLLELAAQIEGFPRHLGIHSGGMIITGAPLMGRVPTEPATMTDRVVVQWDKEGLEDAGLVKIDILGLRMLSAIDEAARLIAGTTGEAPDLDGLTFDDPAVYDMIGKADTIGVFQVESRAQAQVLPRLRPRCFGDLIVSISLIRPGPIQGNMVHPYLRRRAGQEPVAYLHPSLEPALAETLGVILFQEQVLKVARDLAGFTPGQGEQLRRALGAKRADAAIASFRSAFLEGAQANGVSPEVAVQVFEQLQAFGGYSFAKSHAAAFAVLVYQSGWLKRTYPVHFFTALLNNQPMGFWSPAILVNEAQRQGIVVYPVDLARSGADCAVEGDGESLGIRLGFRYVKGLGEGAIERLLAERAGAPFTSLGEIRQRTGLGREVVENLVLSGALDGWGVPRRQLLWQLGIKDRAEPGELALGYRPAAVSLPALTPAESRLGEQAVLGLTTGEQVMTGFRQELAARGILDSAGLAACGHGARVRTAGLLVVHQSPPTAKGFHFLTLEDEKGMINIVVRPKVHARFRKVIHGHRLLLVDGVCEQAEGVTNVLAVRLQPLPS